ncbi:MAG: hypothetical protein VXZ82_24260 [Planctomycetota bacterium]|nr:hypothetical protein [Planctomycetota bacterium]
MQKESTVESERIELLSNVAVLICTNRWDVALQVMVGITQERPDSGPAWELRGLLESHLGFVSAAVSSLEQASLLVPLQPLASRCLALDYISQDRHRLGVELLVSLARAQQDPYFVRRINYDLLKLSEYQASHQMLTESLACVDSALLWHELSATLSKLNRPAEESLSAAMRAISLSPDFASYRVTAASLLVTMNEADDAFYLVRDLSAKQIQELDCSCCLWRLIHIYNCFDSDERVRLCYSRLHELSL